MCGTRKAAYSSGFSSTSLISSRRDRISITISGGVSKTSVRGSSKVTHASGTRLRRCATVRTRLGPAKQAWVTDLQIDHRVLLRQAMRPFTHMTLYDRAIYRLPVGRIRGFQVIFQGDSGRSG